MIYKLIMQKNCYMQTYWTILKQINNSDELFFPIKKIKYINFKSIQKYLLK